MRSGDMAHWPSLMLVGVAVWALQAPNLRPPPCKGAPGTFVTCGFSVIPGQAVSVLHMSDVE